MFNIPTHQGSAIRSHNEILCHTHWDGCHQKQKQEQNQKITSTREDEEIKSLVHCWWDHKMMQPLWKTERECLKILKMELLHDLAISLLGLFPEELEARVQIFVHRVHRCIMYKI